MAEKGTWTFDWTDIDDDLAKVRVLIGDTNTDRQLLSDEAINYFGTQAGNNFGTAAIACDAIAASFAGDSDKEVGDLKLSLSQKSIAYEKRAKGFRKQSIKLVGPVAGGVSIAAKKTQTSDTDRVKPGIRKGQFDNPGGSTGSRFSDLS